MSETRYQKIARELNTLITRGRFPVGSLLPTEMELCEQFGASRHTVRSAMRELQNLGLVSRRKGIGTRVEAAKPSGGYRQSLASINDLVQLAAAHLRVVRRVEDLVLDKTLAEALGQPAGTHWLRISSLRLDKNEGAAPVGWTDVYVPGEYAGLRDTVRRSPRVLISEMIATRYGRAIAEVRQSIGATSVPVALAEELQIEAGGPALKITRHYLDEAGKVFEISISLHPAERFEFSMRLRRSLD